MNYDVYISSIDPKRLKKQIKTLTYIISSGLYNEETDLDDLQGIREMLEIASDVIEESRKEKK